MNTLDLRTATLDEMVFEGRNKMYGAFVLRRMYQRHLATALCIAVSLSLLLVASPLVMTWLFPPLVEAAPIISEIYPDFKILPPPIILEPKPAGSQIRPVPPIVRPLAEVVPKVVQDDLVKPDDKPVTPAVTTFEPSSTDGPHDTVGPVSGTGDGTVGLVSTGSDTAGKTNTSLSPAFVLAPEVMPEFVGGPAALQRYMQKNLRYPPQALRNSVDGRVFISFTVQTDGSIADVQVLKGLGFGTDEEAARVVKNMPDWIPGKQNKQAVAVRYTMPITFRYE